MILDIVYLVLVLQEIKMNIPHNVRFALKLRLITVIMKNSSFKNKPFTFLKNKESKLKGGKIVNFQD